MTWALRPCRAWLGFGAGSAAVAAAAASPGALDTSFGTGGKAGGPLASRQFANALGIQTGGKLVRRFVQGARDVRR